jgi:hypothetical protein
MLPPKTERKHDAAHKPTGRFTLLLPAQEHDIRQVRWPTPTDLRGVPRLRPAIPLRLEHHEARGALGRSNAGLGRGTESQMHVEYKVRVLLEDMAVTDYSKHKGKLLRVGLIVDHDGKYQRDYYCDAIVRVDKYMNHYSLRHWNDEWLDPYWSVTVIHWITNPAELGSTWIDGPSYNAITGVRQWEAKPISWLAYMALRLFGIGKEQHEIE